MIIERDVVLYGTGTPLSLSFHNPVVGMRYPVCCIRTTRRLLDNGQHETTVERGNMMVRYPAVWLLCRDCHKHIHYKGPAHEYMVHNDLWDRLTQPWEKVSDGTLICFDCLENRAGRSLTTRDLAKCPLSAPRYLRLLLKQRRNPVRKCTRRQLVEHVKQQCGIKRLARDFDKLLIAEYEGADTFSLKL